MTTAVINYKELVHLTPFAAKPDKLDRDYPLTNIYVAAKTGELVVADGARMQSVKGAVSFDTTTYFDGFMLDAQLVKKLHRAVKGAGLKPDTVQAHITDTFNINLSVSYHGHTLQLSGWLNTGQYPRYEQLFPTTEVHKLCFHTNTMLEALAAVKPFANKRTSIVKLTYQPTAKTITLSVTDADGKRTRGTPISTPYNGWCVPMPPRHLHIPYLVECLKMYEALNVGFVLLTSNGGLSPVVITPSYDPPNGREEAVIRRHLICSVDAKESN